jgi:hypothetical protein
MHAERRYLFAFWDEIGALSRPRRAAPLVSSKVGDHADAVAVRRAGEVHPGGGNYDFGDGKIGSRLAGIQP